MQAIADAALPLAADLPPAADASAPAKPAAAAASGGKKGGKEAAGGKKGGDGAAAAAPPAASQRPDDVLRVTDELIVQVGGLLGMGGEAKAAFSSCRLARDQCAVSAYPCQQTFEVPPSHLPPGVGGGAGRRRLQHRR